MTKERREPKSLGKRILIAVCAVCLAITCVVSGTIAHYISSTSNSDNTKVAKWEVEVNDVNIATNNEQTMTFDLFATVNEEDTVTAESNVAPGRIAPGTGGSFDIKVENLSEVVALYTLNFTETNTSGVYIQYSLDKSAWCDDLTDINTELIDRPLVMEGGSETVTLYWRWCFDGATEGAHAGQTNEADTALEAASPTILVSASLTAEQAGYNVPPAFTAFSLAGTTSTSPLFVNGSSYTVSGKASSIFGVQSVAVNGEAVTVGSDGSWSKDIALTQGKAAEVTAVTTDIHGMSSSMTGYVVYAADFTVTSSNRAKVGYTGATGENLIIPAMFHDADGTWYKVVGIGGSAFMDCSGLTSVTIPDSVTSVGVCAFENCTGLTSVDLGDGVQTIGGSAFWNCSGLTSVTIPDSVTSVGVCAFGKCTGLTSVTIPEGVTSIESRTFTSCSGLARITLSASVTVISSDAFPTPSSSYITGADGKWYSLTTCVGYEPSAIPVGVADTYVAYPVVLGDVNGDGRVGIADVVLLNAYVKGTTALNSDVLMQCDYNRDGVIDSADVTHLQKNLLGKN